MKKLVSILLTTSMVAASCIAAVPAAADDTHVLRIAISQDPGDMAPQGYSEDVYLKDQLYDTVFHMNYDQEYGPMLCESWEHIDDTHYRLVLRDDIYDSCGNQIKASDVLFTLGMAKDNVNYSGQISEIDVENSYVEDDYTFVIAMSVPNDFAFYGGLGMISIVSEESWNASADEMVTTPVGTGAYKLKSWSQGTEIVLEKNEYYWGDEPYFDEVYFEIIPEPSQMTTALETGEVDLAIPLQKSDVAYIDEFDDLTVSQISALNSYGLWFNMTENSVMANQDLRKAVTYAINNEAIAKVAMGGFAIPAVSACSTVMTDYDEAMNNDAYGYDLEKAKEFMAVSGVPEGTPITIFSNGGDEETAILVMIQEQLKAIGLQAEIVSYEPAAYFDAQCNAESGWDICIDNFRCPSGYGLDLWYKYLGFLNHSKWSGEEWEKTIAFGQENIETTDEEVREANTIEFIQTIEEVTPVYLLVQSTFTSGHKANLNFKYWDRVNLHCAELAFEE